MVFFYYVLCILLIFTGELKPSDIFEELNWFFSEEDAVINLTPIGVLCLIPKFNVEHFSVLGLKWEEFETVDVFTGVLLVRQY